MTAREIVYHLLDQGLIGATDVVDRGLSVMDASRRNSNFRISVDGGASYFVKRAKDTESSKSLRNEAEVYRALTSNAEGVPLLDYLPRFLDFDPVLNLLVLEQLQGWKSLSETASTGRFSARTGSAIGQALGVLHAPNLAELAAHLPILPPPGSLSMHLCDLRSLWKLSAGSTQLVGILQRFPEFGRALDEVRSTWKHQSLIHADVKFDNVLTHRDEKLAECGLKIVDWELAGVGDPAWDAGSVFSAYLSCWLSSLPLTAETPPESWVELAQTPLSRVQPSIRAFWKAYVEGLELRNGESEIQLLKCVRYAAARLLQSALEHTQSSSRVSGNVVCMIQVSYNMLFAPDAAAAELLGISVHPAGFA